MSDQKSQAKNRLLAGCSMAALGVVVVAPAAASWHGLVAAGRDLFGLAGGWEYVVPLSLDGAALYAAALSIRAILSADSAVGARLLTALYALAASGFNFVHAKSSDGNIMSALFFAGASLSAVVLWDVTLRHLRRDQLRTLGAIEAPLPKFRLLRWLVAPVETARAWRLAVVEQLTDPLEALHQSRKTSGPLQAHAERLTDPETSALSESASNEGENSNGESIDGTDEGRRRIEGRGDAAGDSGGGVVRDRHTGAGSGRSENGLELVHGSSQQLYRVRSLGLQLTASTSKADALRRAFDTLGSKDVPAALALLSEHGMTVDRSYAYTVTWSPVRAVEGSA